MANRNSSTVEVALITVIVVGLGIDAWVHFDLASAFKNVKTSFISQADIFRIDAVVAIIAAVAVAVRPRRWSAAFAFLVAAADTVAVVLYRYVNVGKIGPIPNMYDPYWAPAGKWLSAIAEAAAAVAAAALFVMLQRRTARGHAQPAALVR